MSNAVDGRSEHRLEQDHTIFVELVAGSVVDASESVIVICKSLDLSTTGVQVLMDQSIPIGNIIRLCLDTRGRVPIFVAAKVIWQRESTHQGEFHVGFMVLKSSGTDYDAWQAAITEMGSA